MKQIKKISIKLFTSKLITFFVIPFMLISLWISCSIIFNNDYSFSVLEYGHSSNSITSFPSGKLLEGKIITGEFKAKENYLGIVILRFNRYVKPDYRGEDALLFKIKEKGAKDWYYFNSYRSGLIENKLLFPLGFPVINNSLNKTYVFEVESQVGNSTNAVELSSSQPNLITAYQFPKKEIMGSKLRLLRYLIIKSTNFLTNLDLLLHPSLFLLPLIFYLLWQFLLKKKIFANHFYSLMILLLVLLDIFFLREIYLGIMLGLVIAWIIGIRISKLESSVSFIFALILFIVWIICILLQQDIFSIKINMWTYFFLLIAIIQAVAEEMNSTKKRNSYKDFLGNIFKLRE